MKPVILARTVGSSARLCVERNFRYARANCTTATVEARAATANNVPCATRARPVVRTKFVASNPMEKRTNFRTTAMPIAGWGEATTDTTVMAMNTQSGTMYPGQTIRRGPPSSQARHAIASSVSAPAIETSTAAAAATVRLKIHNSRRSGICGFYSILPGIWDSLFLADDTHLPHIEFALSLYIYTRPEGPDL